MKKIINKILLLTLFLTITTSTYIINPFFAYKIDENGVYHAEKSDFTSVYLDKYVDILYDELGYELLANNRTDLNKKIAEFDAELSDCQGMVDVDLSNDKQEKSKIMSIINENPEWFNKISTTSDFIITDSMISIKKGSTYTLKTDSLNTIKWTSSDKKIASVSSSGKVKAKKTGTVVITATDTVTKAKTYCKIYVYIKNKDNQNKIKKKIIKAFEYYNKKENMYTFTENSVSCDLSTAKCDYTCAAIALLTMNKAMGSNNYYIYSTKLKGNFRDFGEETISNKKYNMNITKRINKIIKAKDLQAGDIVNYKYKDEYHSFVVLENNGNSIMICETSNGLERYRRVSYTFINKVCKGKLYAVFRHKKLA